MSEKMTRQELADKVEWEGGVEEAINNYGLSVKRLPDDAPEDVRNAWRAVAEVAAAIELIEEWLECE